MRNRVHPLLLIAVALSVCPGGSGAAQPASPVATATPAPTPAPAPVPSPVPTMVAAPGDTIHQAAMKGDLEAVKRLLAADAALLDARGPDGITPLGFAAALGRADVARHLLGRGADRNARDGQGITPLFIAVWRDRPEIVRLLLDAGADVGVSGPGGVSALHVAAMNGQLEVAGALVAHRADVNARDGYGNAPLHLAAAAGPDDALARLLVAAGAEVNAGALDGATPLDVAVREGRPATAELLRGKGARAGAATEPPRGPFLGQTPPGLAPARFAPGLVSTAWTELCAVFSPDGTEFYFARSEGRGGARMRAVTLAGGAWGRPGPLAFVGDHGSVDMFVSSDGGSLYFCSNRPLDGSGAAKGDTDIWVARRAASGWGEPVNLGSAVNSGENDYYPTLTARGDLYFSSPRAGGIGGNDIYRSRHVDGRLGAAENLGSPINTTRWEFDPFVAPDEGFLLFASDREGGLGRSDLYVSFRNPDGSWATPRNLGEPVNSSASEYTPMLSPDRKYLFFTSGRAGTDDIWWVDAAVLDRFRP